MIDIVSVDQCVLCMACSAACPVIAIHFTKEYYGFLYPEIDKEKCIQCGRCEIVCLAIKHGLFSNSMTSAGFAARHKDDDTRSKSTSGGIFSALADYMLSMGGYVSGAVFTDELLVKHIVTNDSAQITNIRGSKYLQSYTEDVYGKIEKLLKMHVPVLFTGCPCQAVALRTFLKLDYENLYIVDLVCHGIPSVNSWKSYLSLQEKKYGAKVSKVIFRDKQYGWHKSCLHLIFHNGKQYIEPITSDYYYNYGFLGNVFLKASCYQCQFRNFRSGSDMTLGDFWGAELEIPDFDDNKGLSAVLIHSEKGQRIFNWIDLEYKPIDIRTIIANNRNLIESPKVSSIREQYYIYALKYGEPAAMVKYLKERPMLRCKKKIRYAMRKCKHALTGKVTLY